MACDTREKSQNAFKRASKAYEAWVDKGFDKAKEWLQSKDERGLIIPTKVQEQLSDMFNAFNARRSEIYRAGDTIKQHLDQFSEEEGKALVQALNGDADPSTLTGRVLETYKRVRALIDANTQKLIDAGMLSEDAKIDDYLKRYYKQYLGDMGKLAKIFHDRKYKRQDLSYEERIALGMIEDASYVVPRTIAEQRIQLLKGDFLQQLADVFGEEMQLGDDWVQIESIDVGGGIKKHGALSDKWVPLHVKKMLDDAHLLQDELGIAEKYLFPIVDHIKVNVTVKNPVTHIYNVLSNIQVSAIQGTLTNAGRILRMMKEDRPSFDALLKELEPFGLDSMLKDMEVADIALHPNRSVNVFMTIVRNAYMSENSAVGKKIRHLYDWEDKIFKVAAYDQMKREAEADLGRPLSEAEKLAVYKEAVAPYANYSTPLPATFKLLDKTGISPFMHYVYKSTPAVAKLIAKHPLKYAAIQMALIEMGAHVFDDDDDALKPEWAGSGGKINLFGAKDWVRFGNGWYWNAGRMMPGMKIGSVDFSGGFPVSAFKIVNGQTPLGYNIGSKYDTTADKTWDRLWTLAENYAPPLTFGRYGQRVAKKLTGNELKNYYKEDMSWMELGARAAGVRKFNEGDEVAKKRRAFENKLKHYLKEDPDNAATYREAYREEIAELNREKKSRGVKEDAPKSRRRKTTVVPPVLPKKLIDLGM